MTESARTPAAAPNGSPTRRRAGRSQAGGTALILVRNTVRHDARVLREAATLRKLGFEPLIAGVVSTADREPELELEGSRVVRLDPAGALTCARRVLRRRVPPPTTSAGAGPPAAAAQPGDAPPAVPSLRVGVRRAAVTLTFYLQGLALVGRIRPVLVHANDYNTMWIGVVARLLFGSRLVYDCHELWADRNGRPEWRPWLVACEAMFVRMADVTITTSPGYAAALARRYHVPEPVVVRNIPADVPTATVSRPVPGSGALAVYVGGLMPGRGLELAIRALAQARELRLRLIGPGSAGFLAALRRVADEAGVADRVEFVPPVPPSAVAEAIADADMGLMLIEPVCRSYELTLPNKLFEYAAAGLAMLTSDLPVISAIVRNEGIGEVVSIGEVSAVARGMERLAEPERNAVVRARVREFAQRETWEREREVLAAVYRS